MCSKRVFNARPNPTRHAIAESALRLFAERGVENTTMRQIVDAAGISLGTVNFHYGSKLGLAQEVLERLSKEVRDARFAEYDALEAAAGDKPVDLRDLFRALIRPYVEGDEHARLLVIYILQQLKLASVGKPELTTASIITYFDEVAHRTVQMAKKARPHLSDADIWWRYSLGLGAVLSAVSDCGPNNRLARLSEGMADASDRQKLVEESIKFWVKGFDT
ncbi:MULTISPECIES: TetR/AcrR family transcriptional regulator [unclassified Beijerinckia]|uniref:TetR/AcrR family transcriptional regulator n=1 Tax=unclassified Beijerinckia TaxID=2638183 RepID=UPI00089B2B67|nr:MULTISPECIES: TetR/AcrR family transcriptional regulator [unclassified Beijerinckia]MDH7798266.1 AcrR family transcriptional regulator [Beijerinckia sp. GAS462]SED14994.1 transcriptional regulator, TetR family [Beijerinckia sp. 28-YEA-48]